jgi:hypothetical protein
VLIVPTCLAFSFAFNAAGLVEDHVALFAFLTLIHVARLAVVLADFVGFANGTALPLPGVGLYAFCRRSSLLSGQPWRVKVMCPLASSQRNTVVLRAWSGQSEMMRQVVARKVRI